MLPVFVSLRTPLPCVVAQSRLICPLVTRRMLLRSPLVSSLRTMWAHPKIPAADPGEVYKVCSWAHDFPSTLAAPPSGVEAVSMPSPERVAHARCARVFHRWRLCKVIS